jgi:hypothetical protein
MPRKQPMPEIVGLEEIAQMAKVSKERARVLMDLRLHPEAPPGQVLARGRVWLKDDVARYFLEVLGREKTW